MMAAMVDRVAGDPIELGIVAIFLIVVLLILFRQREQKAPIWFLHSTLSRLDAQHYWRMISDMSLTHQNETL
jgi:hypothetical protein